MCDEATQSPNTLYNVSLRNIKYGLCITESEYAYTTLISVIQYMDNKASIFNVFE